MTLLSVKQAAKRNGTGESAIYVAARQNRLKVIRGEKKGNMQITLDSLKEYIASKHNRHATNHGKKIFNKEKGHFSAPEAAEYLGICLNSMYYMIRSKRIAHMRKGYTYVISIEELDRVKNSLVEH